MSEATDTAPAVAAASLSSIEPVVAKYIALRDRKAQLKKKFDADTEAIDAALAKCEAHFQTIMKAQGLTSLPTAAGTPYITHKTSATVADKAAFMGWLLEEPDRLQEYLDIKANKTAVALMIENQEDLPPGINWRSEVAVNVKR